MEPIKGVVAAIKDEYTVILNIGFKDKVEEDMRFIIYSEGEELIDPESGESLGRFENVKAKVKVVDVAENYSTAKSDEYAYIPPSVVNSLASAAALTLSAYSHKQINKPLPLDEEAKKEFTKYEADNIIHIKDRVRQIIS